jgi:hypothetical protein
MWLYLDELQLNFEFRSGRMIFGWVMALELFCSNFKLSGIFLTNVLWDIDLIFGMWLYLVELQFKFEFCSGRMIFGWVMTLELVFFVQILSCPGLFWRPLRYWLDIWYVAISSWVTVEVRISFRSNDFWLSYGPWTCIFCSNFKLSGLFLTSFEILTWYLVCGYI